MHCPQTFGNNWQKSYWRRARIPLNHITDMRWIVPVSGMWRSRSAATRAVLHFKKILVFVMEKRRSSYAKIKFLTKMWNSHILFSFTIIIKNKKSDEVLTDHSCSLPIINCRRNALSYSFCQFWYLFLFVMFSLVLYSVVINFFSFVFLNLLFLFV